MLQWQQQHCRQGVATFAAAALVQKLVTDMLQQTCNKRKKRKISWKHQQQYWQKCSDWLIKAH